MNKKQIFLYSLALLVIIFFAKKTLAAPRPNCLEIKGTFNATNWPGGSVHVSCDGDSGPSGCVGGGQDVSPGQSFDLTNCSCPPYASGCLNIGSVPSGCTLQPPAGACGTNNGSITADFSAACRACVLNTEYNECCAPGKSKHVKKYTWSDTGDVCKWEVGNCDQPDNACGAGPTPTITPTSPPGQPTNTPAPAASTNTPAPLPTNTPSPTPTATLTPTPIQPTKIITMPPTPPPAGSSSGSSTMAQRWVCLKADPCKPNGVPNPNCSGRGILDHRARLTTKASAPVLNNEITYIFECLQSSSGQVCTTGNSSLDDSLIGRRDVGRTNLNFLNTTYGYSINQTQGYFFEADGSTKSTNPVPKNKNRGGIVGPFEWESYTREYIGRTFMAMNQYQASSIIGDSTTQKQGTFTAEPTDKSCVMIKWDPYGKILDSKTRQPVKNAIVTLYKKDNQGNFTKVADSDVLGGIINPIITKENGLFDFKVGEGTYKIEVSLINYNDYQSEDIVIQDQGQELTILLDPVEQSKDDFLQLIKNLLKKLNLQI